MKLRDIKMKRRKYKYLACVCVIVYFYYAFGFHDYMNTKDFDESFSYPLDVDLKGVVELILQGQKPGINPINYYPYKYLTSADACGVGNLELFIAVKSAMGHLEHRTVIRQTYGQQDTVPGRVIKTLFFLGKEVRRTKLQDEIDREIREYRDVIQMDFIDHYFNNTVKTIMSFRWLYENCPNADFYLFTDDDMYISVRNLLNYVDEESVTENPMLEEDRYRYMSKVDELERDPESYQELEPEIEIDLEELEEDKNIDITKLLDVFNSKNIPKPQNKKKTYIYKETDENILEQYNYNRLVALEVLKRDKHLFAGYVFKSAPLRLITSKWRVSLKEYPWDRWPEYVTAGAYVLSNKSMKTLYVGSWFVKHFRFDDIYLGIVAMKVGIKPTHCPNFYYYKKKYTKEGYVDVIASHGYGNHAELLKVWFEQKGEYA